MTSSWEEAAKLASADLLQEDAVTLVFPLDSINLCLDLYTQSSIIDFGFVGALALLGHPSGLDPEILLEEIVLPTLARKQHDYGHANITWGGVEGVILRCHDKVARIYNLQSRAGAREDLAMNESIADSWLDLAGYSIIGIMLEQGTFELPLTQDKETK